MAKRKRPAEKPVVEAVEETGEIKKGDKVLLLQPIQDGMQIHPRESVIAWPLDDPPAPNLAVLIERKKQETD